MLCVRSATGHNVGTTRACWVSAPSHGHFCSWWKAQLLVWFKKLYSEFLSLSAMCFTSQSGLHGSTFSQCKAGRAPLQKRLFVITLASCRINTESPVLFVRLFLTSTSLLASFPLPIMSFSSLVVGKVEFRKMSFWHLLAGTQRSVLVPVCSSRLWPSVWKALM